MRIILILIPYIISAYFVFPMFFYSNGEQNINLGLDLRGGVRLVFKVDFDSYFADQALNLYKDIKHALKANSGDYSIECKNHSVIFRLKKSSDFTYLNDILNKYGNDITVSRNGAETRVYYSDYAIKSMMSKVLEASMSNINNRINELGTTESLVQAQGSDMITVEFPGLVDSTKAKSMIGKTAKLSFHLVDDELLLGSRDVFFLKDVLGNKYRLHKDTALGGENLSDASVVLNKFSKPVISFKFNSVGAKKFATITRENTSKRVAIVLDDLVLTAPVVNEPILDGRGEITGSFSKDAANELVIMLRTGSLPAKLHVVEEKIVGPSLGEGSILVAQKSALLAFVLVSILMIGSYKLLGFIAVIALLFNMLLLFGVISIAGITLTFPGLAAIILTLGMAVDTNVLVFERIKEEIKSGVDKFAAVRIGFRSAMRTIIDANITTIIAAVIIFLLSDGSIRGFSVTLILGILTSLFSSIALTRGIMLKLSF